VIRIAAVGDLHIGAGETDPGEPWLESLDAEADLLLLAGDLTRCGARAEGERVAEELARVRVPTIAVLGNHDYHAEREQEVTESLTRAGVRVLEGSSIVLRVDGRRVGIAGTKGFGGGFPGACGSHFGEPEMKAFIRHTETLSHRLHSELTALEADVKIALLHYSPVPETLEGERREIYPFLGSYLLAEAIDAAGAHLVLHGHAHAGREVGSTPRGIPVRNVARPVLGRAYKIYCLDAGASAERDLASEASASLPGSFERMEVPPLVQRNA
jgi:Icc-related predicted phosphoesterase